MILPSLIVFGCSRRNPGDVVQAPPFAEFSQVEARFSAVAGAPAASAGVTTALVTASELAKAAVDIGIPEERVQCLSATYGVIDSRRFLGAFADSYSEHLRQLGIRYRDDVFVCGQFSLTACTFAIESAARSADPLVPAVGWLVLRVDDLKMGSWPEYHAVVVLYAGKRLRVLEPQTVGGFSFREAPVSRAQLATARLCVF